MKFETKAIHIGEDPILENDAKERVSGDVVAAIHLSTTFARAKVDEPTNGYEYGRTCNPTRKALEQRLAALENAQFGLAFASGMAAETTLMLALLKSDDHVIAFDDLYGGTKRLFNHILLERFNIQFSFVDARNVELIEKSITQNTKMIWIESPTNPLLKLCNIKEIANLAKKYHLLLVIDNTFMSPYFQQPLTLGADIVVHSTTKYINGHSDSVGGALMLNDEKLYNQIQYTQNATGGILSPFDSYLVLRGTKTLALRMQQHEKNALQISQFLEKHPKIAKVIYPGLPSHPDHELARQQMSGFGGMISFEIKGDASNAKRFIENLKYFAIAESLGGVESLIEIPSAMTHASIPKEIRDSIGLTDNLVRLSVGIEHIDDLIADLDSALNSLDKTEINNNIIKLNNINTKNDTKNDDNFNVPI